MIIDLTTSAHIAIASKFEGEFQTISLKVDFYKGIPSGETVFVKSKISNRGNKIWFMNCQIFNEKEQLCYQGAHIKSKVGHKKNHQELKPKL